VKKSNFYPSSLPKGQSAARSRPFGQSPPSVAVGWLLGSSPDDRSLLGSSPGSRRASPRMGSLLGRWVQGCCWGLLGVRGGDTRLGFSQCTMP
jgi:hypothetical protein